MRNLWSALLWQWHHWDVALSHFLSQARSGRQSPAMTFAARLGAHLGDSWFWLLVTAVLWRWRRSAPAPRLRPLVGWALSLLCGVALTLFAKRRWRRPRPQDARLLYGPGVDRYSFPSGHAVRWGIIVAWGSRFVPMGWVWAWPLALWTGWSRVYLGIHYVGDVLVGYGLGLLTGWAVRRLLGETRRA